MTNGHFGWLFQMVTNIVLLTFCCVIGEDLQQVESDTVFKRLDRSLTECIIVYFAVKVGPRSDTNLLRNDTVSLEKGRIVEDILVECEDHISGLLLFCVGDLDSLLGGFKLFLPARNIIRSISDFASESYVCTTFLSAYMHSLFSCIPVDLQTFRMCFILKTRRP